MFFRLRNLITTYILGYCQAGENEQVTCNQITTHRNKSSTSVKPQADSSRCGTPNHSIPQRIMSYDCSSVAIIKIFKATLFYPLNIVQTRMQKRASRREFLLIEKAFDQAYKERDRRATKFFTLIQLALRDNLFLEAKLIVATS